MNTRQRVNHLDLYRSKLHKELDQMQYGRPQYELPVATVRQPKRPAGAWAAAVALLLVGGLVISQAL
jgi:tRNA A37 threonylcarbamoyladenosine biosynthesis protein TsaE